MHNQWIRNFWQTIRHWSGHINQAALDYTTSRVKYKNNKTRVP